MNLKNKPPMMSGEFGRLVDCVSKAALIDALWCAAQLGTDESTKQIISQATRNIVIALEDRGDKVPTAIREASKVRIDSDGDYDAA